MTNGEKKRTVLRFPYEYPARYIALGDASHPPDREDADSAIMDLSSTGMKMRIRGRKIYEGATLLVKIPLTGVPVTVPSLAQVRWVREEKPGAYEAGLMFVLQ